MNVNYQYQKKKKKNRSTFSKWHIFRSTMFEFR